MDFAKKIRHLKPQGMTILEVVFVLLIIAILTSVFIGSLAGLKRSDYLTRAADQVQQDIMFIRARALSTQTDHRLSFQNDTEWFIEKEVDGKWIRDGEVRRFPPDTSLVDGSLENAGANLVANSRGLFSFQNGATGNPLLSIESLGMGRMKSVTVYTGGAIEINTQ